MLVGCTTYRSTPGVAKALLPLCPSPLAFSEGDDVIKYAAKEFTAHSQCHAVVNALGEMVK